MRGKFHVDAERNNGSMYTPAISDKI